MKNYQEKLSTNDLLEELLPLLKDCFIATFTKGNDGLQIRFTSGQTFQLNIHEIQ